MQEAQGIQLPHRSPPTMISFVNSTAEAAAHRLVPPPTEGLHGLPLPPWAPTLGGPKLLGLSPLTRNPHLPSLV